QLRKFLKAGFDDSVKKAGWNIILNNPEFCIISKPLLAYEDINDPVERLRFAEKFLSFDALFPTVSNRVVYGYNRFRNKNPFSIQDSVVTFYLRNNQKATKVMLAGSFNNWQPHTIPMSKTDSGWVAYMKLKPGKYWYKFIVDDRWIVDGDNRLSENDGLGNTNSVFYVSNVVFRLPGFQSARRVYLSGSFNEWQERDLLMEKTSTGWQLPLYLAEGTHTYRFIADGKWMADPHNPDKFPNEFNDYNSVIRLGKPHLFFLKGFPDAKEVVLTGSFNKWRTDELFMQKTGEGWQFHYTLGPGNYEYGFRVDGYWATDTGNQQVITEPGKIAASSFVIDPNYTFRLKGFGDASAIYLAGDFNNWSPTSMPMKKEGNEWVITVHLSAGKHLYKFIVDGKWILDPANKLWEENEHHTGNSVIWIENQ
ncbi:MAG TPA: hypothetical protein VFX58_11915, partial [Chitinophagaceae bacterium]|nr:hypothetical protein [Chitinophagaceae bacterium]